MFSIFDSLIGLAPFPVPAIVLVLRVNLLIVSGGAKVDRVSGRSLTAIIWRLKPASQPQR